MFVWNTVIKIFDEAGDQLGYEGVSEVVPTFAQVEMEYERLLTVTPFNCTVMLLSFEGEKIRVLRGLDCLLTDAQVCRQLGLSLWAFRTIIDCKEQREYNEDYLIEDVAEQLLTIWMHIRHAVARGHMAWAESYCLDYLLPLLHRV